MAEFVTLQLGSIFHNLRQRVEGLRDEILADGSDILRREWALSVRERFYRTGAMLQSAREETVEDGGNRKIWRLFPTATNNGAPYPLFGEYGTGRRGAKTGRPAPPGYRYGSSKGITARRFSRIAVSQSKPQVDGMARLKLRQFAGNVTVS
jgi:hypothetical protein